MVTRSIDNWMQHKQDVYSEVTKKYGEDRAKKFLKFYSDRYDKFGRNLLSWKAAFWLMDDYHHISSVGTKWYACVGDGGTGKTTIMKNILYFIDPSLNMSRVKLDITNFVKQLQVLLPIGVTDLKRATPKSLLLDEPDDEGSFWNSLKGKQLRDILGKARQQKLALAICATDLTDIPTYIFRKLSGIIFLPVLGKAMFFKNRPTKQSYPIQEIRREYAKMGYKVFFLLKKEAGCLSFDTYDVTPFTDAEEHQYLTDKFADYKQSIQNFLQPRKDLKEERDNIILSLKEAGMSTDDIAKKVGKTKRRIDQIIAQATLTKELEHLKK